MTLDQALALLGMLADTVRAQQMELDRLRAQIDALTAALKSDPPADQQ